MMKKSLLKIFTLVMLFTLLFQANVLAATATAEQVTYIYFENTDGSMVIVDYTQALEAALAGDNTLYNLILSYVVKAETNGTKIFLETSTGKILDYQKSLVENKTKLVDITATTVYNTTKPVFTQQLMDLNGVPSIVPAVAPPAPVVTNDDVLNTVSGMAAGMEYSLDGAAYVAYDANVFVNNFPGIHTLRVRIAAVGTTPQSPDTTLLFTADPVTLTDAEKATLAVTAYETAPIYTLAQIASAEALKAPAVAAVAILTDPADAQTAIDLAARITARADVIAAQKAILLDADLTAQANAEIAVAAYESAPIATLVQIDAATVLKTTAELKTALVGNQTKNAEFTLRILTKTLSMAVNEFNLQIDARSMDLLFSKYQAAIGLDLTDYNRLANKAPVQAAMVAPVFASAAEIKSTFDASVIQQLSAEGIVTSEFNNAATAADIAMAISNNASALDLGLSEYNALNAMGKANVQNALLALTFTSGDEIKTAFVVAVINNTNDAGVASSLMNNAKLLGLETISEYSLLSTRSFVEAGVIAAKPIADRTGILVAVFDSTVNSGFIGQLISMNSQFLGLDVTDYNALAYRQKMAVHDALMAAPLTNLADLQTAFTTAVTTQKDFEAAAVAAFNDVPDAASMDMAIATYIKGTHLDNYNSLAAAKKLRVQNTLLTPIFSSYNEFVTALDMAVAAQKAAL